MMGWLDKLVGETQARMIRLLRHSRQTINTLAAALGLTDNAVRSHIAALSRGGLVREAGTERETGGKPARLYDLTPQGEELFPKAYAVVLSGLIQEIARQDGPARAVELLRQVGRAAGQGAPRAGNPADRVRAAADALASIGGEMAIVPAGDGWLLKGDGCPLSSVTAKHHEVCSLAHALVAEVTGQPVIERCQHGDRPRCAFEVLPATA